jgi:hypothetical protein
MTSFLHNIPLLNSYLQHHIKTNELQEWDVVPALQRPGPSEKKRWEMGPIESSFMTLDRENQGASRIFFESIVTGKHATREEVDRGLKLLQKKYPPTSCRFKRLPKSGTWIFEHDPNMQIALKWLQQETSSNEIFQQRIKQKWQVPHDNLPNESGDVIFWVFTSGQGKFQHFILDAPHVIIDGANGPWYKHDLFTFIFEPNPAEVLFVPFPPCMEGTLMAADNRWLWNVIRSSAITVRTLFLHSYQVLKQVPAHDRDQYVNTFVSHYELTKEETSKLHKRCREHGVTVTAAVVSSYLHAIGAEISTNKKNVSTTTTSNNNQPPLFRLTSLGAVDCRYFSNGDVKQSCASMHTSSSFYLSEPRSWNSNHWTLQQVQQSIWCEGRRIRAEMKYQVENRYPIGVIYAAGLGLTADRIKNTPSASLVVSSWGANNPLKQFYGSNISGSNMTTELVNMTLKQAFPLEAHPTLSCYEVVGKLHLTLMAGIPTMDEDVIENVSRKGFELVKGLALSSSSSSLTSTVSSSSSSGTGQQMVDDNNHQVNQAEQAYYPVNKNSHHNHNNKRNNSSGIGLSKL